MTTSTLRSPRGWKTRSTERATRAVIIDTHVLLWWATDSGRLSQIARDTISEVGNQILWSTASTWELAIKASLNRITIPGGLDGFLASLLRE